MMLGSAIASLLLSLSANCIEAFHGPQLHVRSPFHRDSIRLYGAVEQDSISTSSSTQSIDDASKNTQTRPLGSQELLMLPRQYAPHLEKPDTTPFPQMSHVSTALLSSTPSAETLSLAIDEAMAAHPLLRAYVGGDGEPSKRIDLFQMVREGEPNPCTFVAPPLNESNLSSKDVLNVVDIEASSSLEESWKASFQRDLDGGDWCNTESGPLWKVELHRSNSSEDGPCALVFVFNHAISDQSSANLLIEQIVSNMATIEESGSVESKKSVSQKMPRAMEESLLGPNQRWSDVQLEGFSPSTVAYVAGKGAEGLRSPVILPDDPVSLDDKDGSGLLGALTIISGKAPGGESDEERKSTVQFRVLEKDTTKKLLDRCRTNGVTISNVLSAVMALTSTDFIDNGEIQDGKERNYKVLQSLDMRRFGESLDDCSTVACMAGSHDLMLGPLPDRSGLKLKNASEGTRQDLEKSFWKLAKETKAQTSAFIESDGPQQATKVWDFAMTIADMNNLVHLAAQSNESKGRAYSAGIVNAGVFERQNAVLRQNETRRNNLKTKHGKYEIEQIYFATTHARSGCLYQASCLTINGELQCTFHPAMPIVSDETNTRFANSFMEMLEIISNSKEQIDGSSSLIPSALPLAAAAFGIGGIAVHFNAWSNFFQSVMEMKESISDPADFWAALNFWIFFAVGHPVLQPILWISDVLHGTPGPKLADLLPVGFLLGNLAVIGAVTVSKEFRNAVNIFALSAFLTYVGAGLDGSAGLGDFNLALDDSYNGRVVKGCPTYEEVRQPSMDDFDLKNYQGLWYEQKFHDWTQFKEVYDTTLDIKVSRKNFFLFSRSTCTIYFLCPPS
jgi:hypothetical protein